MIFQAFSKGTDGGVEAPISDFPPVWRTGNGKAFTAYLRINAPLITRDPEPAERVPDAGASDDPVALQSWSYLRVWDSVAARWKKWAGRPLSADNVSYLDVAPIVGAAMLAIDGRQPLVPGNYDRVRNYDGKLETLPYMLNWQSNTPDRPKMFEGRILVQAAPGDAVRVIASQSITQFPEHKNGVGLVGQALTITLPARAGEYIILNQVRAQLINGGTARAATGALPFVTINNQNTDIVTYFSRAQAAGNTEERSITFLPPKRAGFGGSGLSTSNDVDITGNAIPGAQWHLSALFTAGA